MTTISTLSQTSEELPYKLHDTGDIPRDGSGKPQPSSIDLKDPDNAEYSAKYDPASGSVTIYRKIGGMNVRLPYSMSLEDYQNDAVRRSMMNYWLSKQRDASAADRAGKGGPASDGHKNSLLNSKWQINNQLFASIFGSDQITMKLQGQAQVSIGAQYNKIDNPTLQERMRATTSFDFDQSVQLNLNSQIGERLKLGINYNTKATFDFENEVKLEYNGDEDDIIQDIQAGNINWTLPGTLIQGSQSLFGFKMDMKFGKLTVSTVFSQKKGESNSITVQNGATAQEFDIDVTSYDKNRHFFLSHRFKEMYDDALSKLPTINSGITINKIEVWVTNKTGNYTDARNIVALTDLGETDGDISNADMWSGVRGQFPSNEANNLYASMIENYAEARDPGMTTTVMAGIVGMRAGRDYEKVENARLLSPSEYTLNEHLGYISLNQALNNNEVLAVAYQYTYRGQTYTVGELSSAGVTAPNCLYLKMLKGTTLTPQYKNWDLMMKNIYSLGAVDVQGDDFDVNVVYYNDSTSTYINYVNEGRIPLYGGQNGNTWLQVMNLDRLDSYQHVNADGKYDYIEGVTVNSKRGLLIFPEREPFGSYIEKRMKGEPEVAKMYAFDALYDSTQVYAKQQTKKNKFRIRGQFQSKNSQDISLNAFNIAQGSVVVTAGGQILTENVDYTVDYSLGKVRILNQGLLNSGTAINIAYENETAISTQTQTVVGAHLNYEFNPDFNVGGTIIHMKESPLTNKVAYGEESVKNTMLGLNLSYNKKLPFLTKVIDALPLVSTKAESSISVEGEVAKLIAGHSSAINAAFIDDFEGSSIKFDIKSWTGWHLASKPKDSGVIIGGNTINDLSTGFDRARIAWYTIDPLFLRNMSNTPRHIRNDKEQKSNHYLREVYEDELYPNRQAAYGESTNIPMLNIAYYPAERGPYNYSTDLTFDGGLKNPQNNWAGIQRRLETTDFEANNIEYIEFWMLDPFIYSDAQEKHGDLYFNLGSISEDVLPDSRKSFEHGLPTVGETAMVDSTAWGVVPRNNSLVKGFNTDAASMRAQDIGLDGLNSESEKTFFNNPSYPFIDRIETLHNSGDLSDLAYNQIMSDPSNDDYHYYRGGDYDEQQLSIMDRYKRFNNTEGNSIPSEYSPESYSTAATTIPDDEDLNSDYTLSETESYYQYHVSIHPDSMAVGKNYIADQMETTVKLPNGKTESVKWFQFKIPISHPDKVIGDISDLTSIQFVRMFMTNFADTSVLRFATLELVRGEWRKYTEPLTEKNGHSVASTVFSTSTVNIEENDRRTPVSYVLPPGVDRVVDPSNPQLRQLNEQAYSLKVTDLGNGDARAVYKTLNMDMRNYRRLKMYVHAEAPEGYSLSDNQVSIFVRLGSDYEDNYYEYEIPLHLTPHGTYSSNSESDRYAVWPEANNLDIPLSVLTECKLQRNAARRQSSPENTVTLQDVYTMTDPDNNNNRVRIKGNPSVGNVVVMMIGLRAHGAGTKSAEVWINELRLTDFNEQGGWAARGRASLKLADLGSIQASGQYASVGFGALDQSVLERSLDENKQFDVSANMELGKLLGPESRISVPAYIGYSKNVTTPLYSPYDTDVRMATVLATAQSKAEKDSIEKISQTTETIRSLNFTNVKIKPAKGKKVTMISPSNLSASAAISTTTLTSPETEYDTHREITGALGYSYSGGTKTVQPFRKSKMNTKYFGLLKDLTFSTAPTQLSYKWEVSRGYQEVQKRNVTNPDYKVPISVSKDFFWNRYFDFRYNITKNLKFGFNATTNARIEEPAGPVNKDLFPEEYKHWKDSVWSNIKKFGTVDNYSHSTDINWTIPINKLPYLTFLTATAQYKGSYSWITGSDNDDFQWGNTIQNRNTKQINGMINLSTFYSKSNYLRELYDHYSLAGTSRTSSKSKQQAKKTVSYNQNGLKFEVGKPVIIKHNLKTTDISARAFDKKGHGLKGTLKPIDPNTATFTPTMASADARIAITGSITPEEQKRNVFKDMTLMLATAFKSLSVTYSENNGTTLAGYTPTAGFLGMDGSVEGSRAPGFKFIVGMQDRDFALNAVNHNWLTTDSTFNEPYAMTHSENLQVRASFEMFRSLKVELSAQRSKDKSLTEYYVFGSHGFEGVFNLVETGSFSTTFNTFKTAFKRPDKRGDLTFSVYDNFLDARQVVSSRRGRERNSSAYDPSGSTDGFYADGYGEASQEVLIPAFVAAYSGKSSSNVFLDFIPGIRQMAPNWRVTFSGLNYIPSLKSIFRSLELSHSYTSKFSMNRFETNLDWNQEATGVSNVRDINGNFVPRYDVAQVSIAEQLSPFISLSATLVNNTTASIGINKSRTLTLNITNNQITETYSTDWNLNLGYRFDNVKIFIKGKDSNFNNTLNLTFGLSQGDQFTILRRIDQGVNELASGTRTTQVKFSADYALTSKFNMQFYYDQSLAKPYISSSYPTNNINVGFSFSLQLTE